MGTSPLSFKETEIIRKSLIVRNLKPYRKPGIFTPPNIVTYPTELQDFSVIDSPDVLIDNSPFSDNLYKINEFGPNGGFNKTINYNNVVSSGPNKGEYGPFPPYTDAIENYSISYQKASSIINQYGPPGGFQTPYNIGLVQRAKGVLAPYWGPPSFRPSLYSPYAVLLSSDPLGSDGTLSLDSEPRRFDIGVALKASLKARVDQNIRTETIGRLTFLESLRDPFEVAQVLAGKRPIVSKDWTITVPSNFIGKAADILNRLAGTYYPVSPIPGDYFDEDMTQNNLGRTQQTVVGQAVAGAFGTRGSRGRTPSDLFLKNTGSGQKFQLQSNIEQNKFRPAFSEDAVSGIFSFNLSNLTKGNFYVGSKDQDPGTLTSPPGALPKDETGREINAPVYGPEVLGNNYENNIQIQNGFAGKSYEDAGGIQGGFTWVSPKYSKNAGKNVAPGGDYTTNNPTFNSISDKFNAGKSTNYEFKPGSILDDTQRLVDSQPNGALRLTHVGNAIDQVSKVFSDGYKELTKGSRVISYTNDSGTETGREYCRVFAKDKPYLNYENLQKQKGSIYQFVNSVITSTYNLNIVPTSNNVNPTAVEKNVTKYMFSIENLAWRTSNKEGFRVSDLPACERGPNGGRVMWFPPYGLTFNEDSRPSFNENTFIGRPEPVYTYKHTSRSGSLSFKIVVDHPSILNLIVNKVLANADRETADNIIDSFFAGCKEYDLYDLAQTYNTIPASDLVYFQTIVNTVTPQNPASQEFAQPINQSQPSPIIPQQTKPSELNWNKYKNLGFYFYNDYPDPNTRLTQTTSAYDTEYQFLISKENTFIEVASRNNFQTEMQNFFDDIVIDNFSTVGDKLIPEIKKVLDDGTAKSITISLIGSASAPATRSYNVDLSKRRIDSVKDYFENKLGSYIQSGKLKLDSGIARGEEESNAILYSYNKNTKSQPYSCTDLDTKNIPYNKIFSVQASACRRVAIKDITYVPGDIPQAPPPPEISAVPPKQEQTTGQQPKEAPKPVTTTTIQQKIKNDVSKRIIRSLLSECNYFDILKSTDPVVFDSIKDKIKYFNPTFHSMTPEGLNSRLTFLQQCTRPGDTIPTIGLDGKPVTDVATNTSFGAPPVLVLRIGDFYNTKIIPTSLSFKYENFDLNPEGIGMQPMICDVTLSFNFIGGSGLKEPIEKLQNALSFNYYANTEMYDERAESTEDREQFNQKFISALGLTETETTTSVSQATPVSSSLGGATIGEIKSTTTSAATSGTSSVVYGNISYTKVFDGFVTQSKNYFNGVYNFLNDTLKNYNYGVLQNVTNVLKYNTGKFNQYITPQDVSLFGSPVNVQNRFTYFFSQLQNKISNGSLSQITFLEQNRNVKNSVVRDLKRNYSNYVSGYSTTFLTKLSTSIQSLNTLEQDFIFTIDKLNYILTQRDGYLVKGEPLVYKITGGTTISGITTDMTTIGTYNNQFIDKLTDGDFPPYVSQSFKYQTEIFPVSKYGFTTTESKLEYMLMSDVYINDYNNFITKLTEGITDTISLTIINDEFGNVKSTFETAYNTELSIVNDNKDTINKDILNVVGINVGLDRTCSYTTEFTPTNDDKTRLVKLLNPNNDSDVDNPYNFKKKFKL